MAQIFSRCGVDNSLKVLDLSDFTSNPQQARKVLTVLSNSQITGLKSLQIDNLQRDWFKGEGNVELFLQFLGLQTQLESLDLGNFLNGKQEDRMKILKGIRASPCLHTLKELWLDSFDFCGTEFMEVLAGILAESTSITSFDTRYQSHQQKFSVQRTVQQRD